MSVSEVGRGDVRKKIGDFGDWKDALVRGVGH